MLDIIKDPKVIFSFFILVIGAICVFAFPNSNPHMILGTNAISAVGGYWIGTSISSSNKDKHLFKGETNETQKTVVDSTGTIVSG